MKALPPAAEDVVLEGVVVEHNGVPLGSPDWFGQESKPYGGGYTGPTGKYVFHTWNTWPRKSSAHFVVDGDHIYDGQTGQKLN